MTAFLLKIRVERHLMLTPLNQRNFF